MRNLLVVIVLLLEACDFTFAPHDEWLPLVGQAQHGPQLGIADPLGNVPSFFRSADDRVWAYWTAPFDAGPFPPYGAPEELATSLDLRSFETTPEAISITTPVRMTSDGPLVIVAQTKEGVAGTDHPPRFSAELRSLVHSATRAFTGIRVGRSCLGTRDQRRCTTSRNSGAICNPCRIR